MTLVIFFIEFYKVDSKYIRTYLFEFKTIRNEWAHNG